MRNSRWAGAVALALVLLSLAASLLAPVLFQRRIDRIRGEVDGGADQARTLVTGIQFSLAREMSALRGFLITGEDHFVGVYDDAVAGELRAHAALEPLVRELGGEVFERFVVLRTLSEQWHEEMSAAEIVRLRRAWPSAPERIRTEQELYESALAAARDLDAAIGRAAQRGAQEVRAVERQRQVVLAGMLCLAFASSLVVAWLGDQVRRLAAEAERQRVMAVGALADSRRTLESRSRLVRGITHDIKNPLGAADGYAELLAMGLHGPLLPEQTRMVARLRACIADALGIIRDLLEISRAESGTLPVLLQPVDLAGLVAETAAEYEAAAAAAGRVLEVDASASLPVHTDPARVRQVLGNLISNAIKYARGCDRVVLAVRSAPAGAVQGPGPWAAVQVIDSGPGIRPEALERLFEEFYRADAPAAVAGHGLGLAMSRRVATLLGGALTAESTPGRGATFTLWLPAGGRPAGAAPPPEPSRKPLPPAAPEPG